MINIDKKVSEGKIDFNLNIDKQKQDIVQIKLLNRPDKIDN